MKKLLLLLFIGSILFVTCTQDTVDDNGATPCLSCEQLLDVTTLDLYPFISFTEEEMRTLDYDVKLELRQIPDDILQKMPTKAVFYQFVGCDLSKNMYLYNSAQSGFRAIVEQLNMLPELLNRLDAGHFLLGLLQQVDLSNIDGPDCFHLYECLQRIIAQPEIINAMTYDDVKKFIPLMMRHQETIGELAETNGNWNYPESLVAILFGLGNVMIKYEYEPFIHLLETDPGVNGVMMGENLRNEQIGSLINNCITGFINDK
jgi:hypothetical protein